MAAKATTQRRLASISIAADYAGVCTKTIRRRIADGTLTSYRLGSRIIRVDLDELDRLLTGSAVTAGRGNDE